MKIIINKYLSIVLKLALIVLATIGIWRSVDASSGFMGGSVSLFYFTIQSNIWIALTFVVFLVYDILKQFGKQYIIPNWLMMIKYVFTVSISLTFVVFALLLSSFLPWSYLSSINNIALHYLVPIIAIVDFVIFDYKLETKKLSFLFACIPPLYYLAFAEIISVTRVIESNGEQWFPYFFLDYVTYGWFNISSNGIGVFYWIIIIILFICGMGIGYIKIKNMRRHRLLHN